MCQFLEEIDYHTAFKCLAEPLCNDALDAHYMCFWDVNILEYLIYLQTKRNNKDRAKKAVRKLFTSDNFLVVVIISLLLMCNLQSLSLGITSAK